MSLESFCGTFLFCPTVQKAVLSSDPVEDIGLFAASQDKCLLWLQQWSIVCLWKSSLCINLTLVGRSAQCFFFLSNMHMLQITSWHWKYHSWPVNQQNVNGISQHFLWLAVCVCLRRCTVSVGEHCNCKSLSYCTEQKCILSADIPEGPALQDNQFNIHKYDIERWPVHVHPAVVIEENTTFGKQRSETCSSRK